MIFCSHSRPKNPFFIPGFVPGFIPSFVLAHVPAFLSKQAVFFWAVAVFWIQVLCIFPGTATAGTPSTAPQNQPPAAMDRAVPSLDEKALKAGIAQRLRTARGVKDERFRQITSDHVTVEKKIPVQIATLTVFAVKLKITPPVPELFPEFITLVVDGSGTIQLGGIQELATGTDLAKEAVEQLQSVEFHDLPADFGKPIYAGTGPHTVILVSDPFCPHCRRGWEFIKTNLDRIHTLRLAHFPLSPAAETAGMVMADAYHRETQVFDIIDFTYSRLEPSQDLLKILAQYMEEFPDLAAQWGKKTPEEALTYLKARFLPEIKAEQHTIRSLGIHSTPIFFVNQTFIKGFNEQKMEAAMP
jgi:protein-disulfide isomerase